MAELPLVDGISATDPRLVAKPLIVVRKAARRLMLFERGDARGCWRVGLGAPTPALDAKGPKEREGDRRTPEGWYRTSDKPWSSFYAAIAVHYPNPEDAARGLSAGQISTLEAARIRAAWTLDQKPPQRTALGGEILVHGGGGDSDWTLGCIAMDDEDIDRLRAQLPASMRVDILILP